MAAETLATILTALPQLFSSDIVRQWNRTTMFLGVLQARPGAIDAGAGKNVSFITEFSGATAQTVAEGSDIAASEYNSDANVPAIFSWATYRSSFEVSEVELDAARLATGSASALTDLFGERVLGCAAQIASQIENDALIGTGVDGNGNPTLVGVFGGMLTASGSYGGINAATYSEWASNVVSNGGVNRALTPDLLGQVDQNIFTASSLPWNFAMTTAGVTRKYEGFFSGSGSSSLGTPIIRMNDTTNYQLGAPNDRSMQLSTLTYKGQPLVRNRLVPSGQFAFLNTDYIKLKYLPHVPSRAEKMFLQSMNLEGSTGGIAPIQATGIPMRVVEIAKTGDSVKVSMRATVALAATRRNCMGTLTNILET